MVHTSSTLGGPAWLSSLRGLHTAEEVGFVWDKGWGWPAGARRVVRGRKRRGWRYGPPHQKRRSAVGSQRPAQRHRKERGAWHPAAGQGRAKEGDREERDGRQLRRRRSGICGIDEAARCEERTGGSQYGTVPSAAPKAALGAGHFGVFRVSGRRLQRGGGSSSKRVGGLARARGENQSSSFSIQMRAR